MSSTDRPAQFSLVVPCFNEQDCIEATARDLLSAFSRKGISLELVLVDNGSKDSTGQIIDGLVNEGNPVRKVDVPVNQGYGYGCIQGLRACTAPYVGTCVADGQVKGDDIALMASVMLAAGPRALVKARRQFRKDGLLRKVQSTIYNFAMTVLFSPMGSLDYNGSPKMFSRKACRMMELQSKNWFIDPEIVIKSFAIGLWPIEINVEARHRQGGKSHVRWHTCLEFLTDIWSFRVGRAGRRWRKRLDVDLAPDGE